ncbi:hypothetical protein HBI81_185160 [Parastagonospora nodorum]|nr:hypothetical protein HBH51_234180 [Parastagonospora nodorum]KAH3964338.1 hypothetical protein HBH52_212440 [Parastagonospora nodorum]KAH4061474.1 hypothetical protein HBH50_221350 [Parastagonospora nodorum]KAH4079919.1 hypothetical protein HBH48_214840 [Parastagonospora nodorum]KAH4094407.1 hypothetical protein HBH46_174020 [Parastagonospora nodorum]
MNMAYTATTQPEVMDGKKRLTNMGRRTRLELTTGKLIDILGWEGRKVMDFPLALFNAASIKPELVIDDQVTLPSDLDVKIACYFLSQMMKVPPMSFVCYLGWSEITYDDIMFHSTAEALGMGSFTQNIFSLYFKRVNTTVPSVANIEAIGRVRTPPGDKIYKQMAYNIGVKYFDGKIENRAAFEAYLQTNPRLAAAVADTVDRKSKAAAKLETKEKGKAKFEERELKRQEKAFRTTEQQGRDGAKQSTRNQAEQQEREFLLEKAEERRHMERAVRESMLEKKRLGKKMTPQEAIAHEKLFGRHVAC